MARVYRLSPDQLVYCATRRHGGRRAEFAVDQTGQGTLVFACNDCRPRPDPVRLHPEIKKRIVNKQEYDQATVEVTALRERLIEQEQQVRDLQSQIDDLLAERNATAEELEAKMRQIRQAAEEGVEP